MERKFYPENFEKFLKEHADQFKMTPSKKTWHGIYNDLHPGTRWPSITVSLVFIFALVIIGHLNSNNEYHNSTYGLKLLSASNVKPPGISSRAKLTSISSTRNSLNKENTLTKTSSSQNTTASNNSSLGHNRKITLSNTQSNLNNYSPRSSTAKAKAQDNISGKSENNSAAQILAEPSTGAKLNTETNTPDSRLENTSEKTSQLSNKTEKIQSAADKKNNAAAAALNNTSAVVTKAKRVRNNPAVFTYYLSPSLSYRNFSDKEVNSSVTHKPMIGYEGGVAISTKVINQLHFTTGLQLNYSGYNIKASTTHPIIASLLLNTDMPGQSMLYSTISSYGNGTGNAQTKLKNYSLQISLPVGLQYSFGGNDDVSFSAEATLQPLYVIKNRAYLISTDGKNYLSDPDLSRNWNINTNFGTYVSFKSSTFKWQIGPQVRYQMLSSYLNTYPVKEHLVNYGVRVGISKISK